MGVNATPKKKEEDFFQIDGFHYKKKGYYANMYPQKKKQESKN